MWDKMKGTAVYESHIFTAPGEEDTTGHTRPHRGCTQEQSEQAGGLGGRLYSNQRVWCPWFPWEDMMGLFV